MRVQPRTNDDVNEEWISDKTRYAYDGLQFQRLTTPLIKSGDRFVGATWEQALEAVKSGLEASGAQPHEIKAIAGHLADTESLLALRDLMHRLGSENLTLDQSYGDLPPVGGTDIRSNYLFNSGITGLEEADAILLIGTNPRHEAAVMNSRIRKSWMHTGLEVGLVGENADLAYGYEHIGASVADLKKFVESGSKGAFGKKWKEAKRPMIIVGSGVGEGKERELVYGLVSRLVQKEGEKLVRDDWNGFCVLQRVSSRTAAYDLSFSPSSTSPSKPKFVYLLNADEVDPSSIPQGAFVVYQGHHGDLGAQLADVVLPGAAYTEKSVTWVNTEGRAQQGRAAVGPPGAAREDWKIVRALSEVLGEPLPYDDILSLRDRMWEVAPHLVRYDVREPVSTSVAKLGLDLVRKNTEKVVKDAKGLDGKFGKTIGNFYMTDVVSRNSVTMAQCTKAFVKGEDYGFGDVGKGTQSAFA
ncbi:hypothetical protein BDQ17DRAFT_1454662 [Cyathus striatus]|nr:hypothetical protein BDQ17DRAFT_1454662 [Cyathus striatus]